MDKPILISIFEQLNRKLFEIAKGSNIMGHNLEKGLSNEQIIRSLLVDFLPEKYGVAKGIVINNRGQLSRQCDLIIYDKMNFPKLFIDANDNQILPIESVFCVWQVKTTLTKVELETAFENLWSIYQLQEDRPNRSTRTFVDLCPPDLQVFAFRSSIKLETIAKQYHQQNRKFPVKRSYSSYSKKSPGYKEHTHETFLVSSIQVLNEGSAHHMYDGTIRISPYKEYTLGVHLTDLVETLGEIKMPIADPVNYFNYVVAERLLNERNFPKK